MKIHREMVGVTKGHLAQGPTQVDAYTLDTQAGLAVTVWTLGASLVEVVVPDRHGRAGNVVARFADLSAYDRDSPRSYLGATVGRYARCVVGGRFRLDGVEHQLDRNEGPHHFHGGPLGFDRFVWDATAARDGDRLALRLRLERPDGDQGYPGALRAQTTYRVSGDGRLGFEHQATTTASTIVDVTNHTSWNLAGTGRLDEQQLAINARRVLLVDEELIPIGAPVDTAVAGLEFSSPRPIAGARLDHCFALDDPAWAAELFDPASGRHMRVTTDQPGLQVYSGDALVPPRSGITLQTGGWPDAPNRADYPPVRLDPHETYRHRTTHGFSVR
jgi:aldose 1-epimerase